MGKAAAAGYGETAGIGRPTSDQNPAGHRGNGDGISVNGDFKANATRETQALNVRGSWRLNRRTRSTRRKSEAGLSSIESSFPHFPAFSDLLFSVAEQHVTKTLNGQSTGSRPTTRIHFDRQLKTECQASTVEARAQRVYPQQINEL